MAEVRMQPSRDGRKVVTFVPAGRVDGGFVISAPPDIPWPFSDPEPLERVVPALDALIRKHADNGVGYWPRPGEETNVHLVASKIRAALSKRL